MLGVCVFFVGSGFAPDQSQEPVALKVHPAINASVRPLERLECKKILGKNIIKYGYIPVSLEFYNDSDDVYLFRAASIPCPIERVNDVLNAVCHQALLTTYLTVGLSAIYFWPAIIPSIGLGAWMAWDNNRVAQKCAREVIEKDSSFEILPYERVQKVIIVHASACPVEGTFTLFNIHTKAFVPCRFAI